MAPTRSGTEDPDARQSGMRLLHTVIDRCRLEHAVDQGLRRLANRLHPWLESPSLGYRVTRRVPRHWRQRQGSDLLSDSLRRQGHVLGSWRATSALACNQTLDVEVRTR